jgi:hypothetical protein
MAFPKRPDHSRVLGKWDRKLAALKFGARAAADDGAPHLHAALFGRLQRPPRGRPR